MHRTAAQKSIGFADVFASLTIALGMASSPLLSGAASAEEDASSPTREQAEWRRVGAFQPSSALRS